MWWSWILGTIGVTALAAVGKYYWQGWMLATVNEALWIVYGLTTHQYGFIVAAIAYGAVDLNNMRRWWKHRK
jgi:hypothetical protein